MSLLSIVAKSSRSVHALLAQLSSKANKVPISRSCQRSFAHVAAASMCSLRLSKIPSAARRLSRSLKCLPLDLFLLARKWRVQCVEPRVRVSMPLVSRILCRLESERLRKPATRLRATSSQRYTSSMARTIFFERPKKPDIAGAHGSDMDRCSF